MTLKEIPDGGNILLSGDELKHALEKQLAELLGVIASHDEKIADLEAIKVRYQRIIDASPENESAAQEIVELQGDIVPLVASRNLYAIERQTIREQIKTLNTPSIVDVEPKVDGPLLAKIEAMRQRAASRAMTPDLFGGIQLDPGLANTHGEVAKVEDDKSEKRERSKLLPARYMNQDFFVADILGYSLKDDQATMEAPVFSLKTQKDLTPWEWTSKDGTKHIEVSPSVKYGRATQHDKDVLIFVTSQMTEALNRERPDAQNRTVRFTVHNYLVATNKPTGGVEYQRFERALDRLKGTTIKTDIRTGEKRVKEAFGILDSWTIVERSPDDERMVAVEVTMSKWLYKGSPQNSGKIVR